MIANEVAKVTGVNASVVRYYSRIGLLQPLRNPDNGYREFSAEDARRIRFIRKAQWLGFTLKDAELFLKQAKSGESPCDNVRKIIRERIRENEQRLARLQAIQDRMEAAIEAWEFMPDRPPGRKHVCELIESLHCD
jgi:DNA-binding transcriptional MerR regulator